MKPLLNPVVLSQVSSCSSGWATLGSNYVRFQLSPWKQEWQDILASKVGPNPSFCTLRHREFSSGIFWVVPVLGSSSSTCCQLYFPSSGKLDNLSEGRRSGNNSGLGNCQLRLCCPSNSLRWVWVRVRYRVLWASQVALVVKNLPASAGDACETSVQSLGQEDPLEEGRATPSSILAWRIPWTEEPGELQSIGSHRVRHDWSDLACTHACT